MDRPRVIDANKSLPLRLVLPVQVGPPQRQVTDHIQAHTLNQDASTGTADNTTHTKDHITSLPLKPLALIHGALAHPRDQVAFAITCRRFAGAARSKHATLLKPGTILRRNRNSTYTQQYGQEHLLGDLRSWGFIPKHLKLCRSCWRFLPRRRIWLTREGRPLKTLRHVDWTWAVMRWANEGKVCPTCQIPEGYDDSVKGQFLQRVGEGLVRHAMVVQTYEVDEESEDESEESVLVVDEAGGSIKDGDRRTWEKPPPTGRWEPLRRPRRSVTLPAILRKTQLQELKTARCIAYNTGNQRHHISSVESPLLLHDKAPSQPRPSLLLRRPTATNNAGSCSPPEKSCRSQRSRGEQTVLVVPNCCSRRGCCITRGARLHLVIPIELLD